MKRLNYSIAALLTAVMTLTLVVSACKQSGPQSPMAPVPNQGSGIPVGSLALNTNTYSPTNTVNLTLTPATHTYTPTFNATYPLTTYTPTVNLTLTPATYTSTVNLTLTPATYTVTPTYTPIPGSVWTQTSGTITTAKSFPGMLSFNNLMWIIGGKGNIGNGPLAYTSSDGSSWNVVLTPDTGVFSDRAGHGSVVFDDGSGSKLWVIGGQPNAGGTYSSEVWCSPNGTTWTKKSASAAFGPLAYFGCTVFNNKMWVVAGATNSTTTTNKVYSSSDGITWNSAPGTPAFGARSGLTCLAFDDGSGMKLWILGGGDYNNPTAEVWCSADGSTWTQKTASADFGQRRDHTSVVFDGKMWVNAGGANGSALYSDVWYSNNGITWIQSTANAYTPCRAQGSTVYNGKMWVAGGTNKPSGGPDINYAFHSN